MKRRGRQDVQQLLVFGIGGALAIVLLVLGILATNTDQVDDNALTRTVENRIPSPAATVQLQSDVGIELDATRNFQVQICVDGIPLPADEYVAGDPNLGQFIFRPGPERAVREWSQGPHQVVVGYWSRAIAIEDVWPDSSTCEPPASGGVEFISWRFTAA
jgi:hypothetical protein